MVSVPWVGPVPLAVCQQQTQCTASSGDSSFQWGYRVGPQSETINRQCVTKNRTPYY